MWVGTGSVEITQGGPAQAIRLSIPSEDALDHPLRFTVRVDWILWLIFSDGNTLGDPVRCTAGRKNNMLYPHIRHCVQQPECVTDVGFKILSGTPHGFAHIGEPGKVDNGLDSVGFHYFANQFGVAYISFDKRT